jgi:NAD(P)H dehydrogenase (quinone)
MRASDAVRRDGCSQPRWVLGASRSYDEVASAIGTVAGRPVTYEPVRPEAYDARLLEAGVPGWRAFDLAHIASAYTPADRGVRNSLETILGHPPRSLSEFLADHHGAFN